MIHVKHDDPKVHCEKCGFDVSLTAALHCIVPVCPPLAEFRRRAKHSRPRTIELACGIHREGEAP